MKVKVLFSLFLLVIFIFLSEKVIASKTGNKFNNINECVKGECDSRSIKDRDRNRVIHLVRRDTNEKGDYNDKEDTEYDEDTDYSSDYDEENQPKQNPCSLGNLLNSNFLSEVMPSDYEESKYEGSKRKVNHLNESMETLSRMINIGKNISSKFESKSKRAMPQLMDFIYGADMHPECMAALIKTASAARNREMWAAKLFDAQSTVISPGMLIGGPTMMGHYDECLSVESPPDYERESHPIIRGQYCKAKIILPMPALEDFDVDQPFDNYFDEIFKYILRNDSFTRTKVKDSFSPKMARLFIQFMEIQGGQTFMMGICLPTGCKPEHLQDALNKAFYPILRIPFEVKRCISMDEPIELDEYQFNSIIAYSILIGIVIFGTFYDLYNRYYAPKQKPSFHALALSFSLIINTKSLFAPPGYISCCDSIRALFAAWMFFIHAWAFPMFSMHTTRNLISDYSYGIGNDWNYIWMRNIHTTDFIFFLSGMLLTYVMLGKLDKSKGRFEYFGYAMYRFLKISPVMIASCALYWLTPLILDGPMAEEEFAPWSKSCKEYWPAQVFLVNNYFFNLRNQMICNSPGWTVATGFQLYLISPIIFLVMYHKPRLGVILAIVATFVGSIAAVVPTFYGISSFFGWRDYMSMEEMADSVRWFFYMPNYRSSCFALGMLVGYVLKRHPNVYLGGKVGETIIWIVTWTLTIWEFVWAKDWFINKPSQLNEMLYHSVGKLFWVAGWGWTVFACTTGRADRLNRFLSRIEWQPVARMSLGIAILNPFPIIYRVGRDRESMDRSGYGILSTSLFDWIITLIMSYLLYVLVECPSNHVVNVLLLGKKDFEETSKESKNSDIPLDKVKVSRQLAVDANISTIEILPDENAIANPDENNKSYLTYC